MIYPPWAVDLRAGAPAVEVLLSCSTRRVCRRICSGVTPSLRSTSTAQAFLLTDQTQQQMFGTDIMMPHAAGFVDGEFQHLLDAS